MPLNLHITYAAIFLAAAQILFLVNLIQSFRRGVSAPANPWQATTLEWHPDLAPNVTGDASNETIVVFRQPCEYTGDSGKTFTAQWEQDAPIDPKPE